MADRIQTFLIKQKPVSLNEFYAGVHWTKRSKYKDDWTVYTISACNKYQIEPVEEYPVTIDARVIFGPGQQRYDWDNTVATVKLVQDALVKKGIIEKDSVAAVAGGRIWPVRGDYNGIMIGIREGKKALPFH